LHLQSDAPQRQAVSCTVPGAHLQRLTSTGFTDAGFSAGALSTAAGFTGLGAGTGVTDCALGALQPVNTAQAIAAPVISENFTFISLFLFRKFGEPVASLAVAVKLIETRRARRKQHAIAISGIALRRLYRTLERVANFTLRNISPCDKKL
jgi:hypothetical protein